MVDTLAMLLAIEKVALVLILVGIDDLALVSGTIIYPLAIIDCSTSIL